MKNILYIAPIYDGTGYAHMANNTILVLDKAGHNITVRKQKLTGQIIPPPNRVVELESKEIPDNLDVVIQHSLPPHFVYRAGVKNIGYFHWETDNIMPSNWHLPLSLMDELWVSWEENAQMLRKMMQDGDLPEKPVRVVTGAVIDSVVSSKTDRIGFSLLPYTFYHIGDFSARKGTVDLLTAYLREFTAADNVQLVLKSYVDSKSTQDSIQIISNAVNDIKMSLRNRANGNWPKIHLIAQYLTEEGISALHQSCDCFITLERGAAWNIPAFEAWQHGQEIIATDYGGQVAFLQHSPETGVHILPTEKTFVYGMKTCGYPGVYTCYEHWRQPKVEEAQTIMRECYNKGKRTYTRTFNKFSLESVVKEFVHI